MNAPVGFILFCIISFVGGVGATIYPTSLRVNSLINPLAVLVRPDGNVTASPLLFSWSLNNSGSTRAIVQQSWRLQIFRNVETLICDENATLTNFESQAVYACSSELSQLSGGTRLLWQVSVLGSDSQVFSNWSQIAEFGISPDLSQWNQIPWFANPIDQNMSRPYRFRTIFTVPASIQINKATLYVATPAYYILSSNCSAITDRFPMSTFTIFSSRVDYDAFDVTSLVTQAQSDGSNLVPFGLRLGGGAFATDKFKKVNNALRLPLRVIAILDCKQGNNIVLSSEWKTVPDSILYSDWYAGEVIDNRLETNFNGWDTITFNDSLWTPSTACNENCGIENARLIPQLQPPVRLMKDGILTAVSIHALSSPERSFTISFGQNFAGYIELDVPTPSGSAGTTIFLYAGERLFSDNSVYNQLNSSTQMTLNWTLSGLSSLETIGNVFSFWGFQHVQINNWPLGAPPPTTDSLRGYPTSTLERRATIEFDGIKPSADIAASFVGKSNIPANDNIVKSSSLLLDAEVLAGVEHAAYWSQSSNYQSIPSDCPNREKRAWMGDGAVSALQASTVFDTSATYYSWTRSHGDDQAFNGHSGVVNNIVPAEVDSAPSLIDAAWGLAVVEVVYQSVMHFFEDRTLKERYTDMKAFTDWLTSKTNISVGIMKDEWQFGDWDAQFPRTQYVPNTGPMGATGSWLRCLRLMEELASLAGHPEDAAGFRETFNNAITPFNDYYALNLTNGTYGDGEEQTLAIIPLNLGIVPSDYVISVQNWLIHDVETTQALHLTTGATGTRFFFETLTQIGRVDLAAVVAAQSTLPSHGFWITQGATTCWENWSGEVDEPHPPPPTHNHIFLCSQLGWIYDALLGLSVKSSIIIMPPLIDSLPSMNGAIFPPGSRESPAELSWTWTGSPMASTFQLNASIPLNMNATISFPVPGLSDPIITESGQVIWQGGKFSPISGIFSATQIGNYVTFYTGSGNFVLSSVQSTKMPVLVSKCVNGIKFSNASVNLDLICPLGAGNVSRITRAGILRGVETALQFSQPHVHQIPQIKSKLFHRFLLTHTIERLCPLRADKTCSVSSSSLSDISSRIINELSKEEAQLCVVATCD